MMATKAKKKAPGTGDNGAAVEDITHEEVPNTGNQVAITAKVITVEDQIKLELAKFNVADSAIAKMKQEYGALTITDPADKKGYEAVKKAWNHTRSTRTSLEKKGLELRGAYKVITTAISGEEDRLVDLITPLEDDLYKKWKAIDDEKERAKKEQEEKEQAQLMARVEEIQTLGMKFVDGFYQIGGTISVDVASLRGFNDAQFEKLKGAITAKKSELDKAEADRLEQVRLDNEQREREAQKLREDQKRLDDERAELDRQRKEIEDQRMDAARMKLENRSNQLTALGMKTKGDQFVWDNGFSAVYLAHSSAENASPEEWRDKVAEVKQAILESTQAKEQHDREVEQEKKKLEDHKKFIAASMDRAGLSFSYSAQSFTWEDKNTAIEVTFAELIPLTEPEISDKAEALKVKIQEAKDLTADRDKKAKEAHDKEAKLALNDRDRFFADVAGIEAILNEIKPAEYKTKEFKAMATRMKAEISNILTALK